MLIKELINDILDKDIIEQEAKDKLNKLHPEVDTIPVVQNGIPWANAEQ